MAFSLKKKNQENDLIHYVTVFKDAEMTSNEEVTQTADEYEDSFM